MLTVLFKSTFELDRFFIGMVSFEYFKFGYKNALFEQTSL